MYSGTITLNKGSTVYDALKATGVSISGNSTYVKAINGLAEKQVSPGSGWMYDVNGSTPMKPCGKYTLNNGDNIRWYYVV